MSETNHTATILIARTLPDAPAAGDYRGYLHLCDPTSARETMVRSLLENSGRPIISATHLYAVVAGPENPSYATAVTALGLTSVPACDHSIVKQAMEMMVMSELLPPLSADDGTMAACIESLFATESDWDDLVVTSARVIEAWLADARNRSDLEVSEQMRGMLIGGLSCAMAQARADWTY